MGLKININTGSTVPIYKQITEQVRMAVATGRLVLAEQLPSVRALAETLVLNPNTVARAYADLSREGLIETQPGRGVFVIPKRRVFHAAESRRRLEPLINTLISEAMALGFTPDELQESFEKKLSQWKQEKGAKV
jgi:GntR family transcriptional regulator